MEIVKAGSEQTERSDHSVIDIANPYLATAVKNEPQNLHLLWSECAFCRVPNSLRELDEDAYTPRIVSIGPIHHGRKELQAMEKYKRRYLQDFLQQAEVSLNEFIKVIVEKEEMVRSCFTETIHLNSDDFVKMVLLDAAFIIEVLLMSIMPVVPLWDYAFSNPHMIHYLKDDMFMFENQLPFFILEDLFRVANIAIYSNAAERLSLLQITFLFTREYWGYLGIEEIFEEDKYSRPVRHLLDFLKISILPCDCQEIKRPKSVVLPVPSVTELYQAGVKFKLVSNKKKVQLRFSDGILEIPQIKLGSGMGFILKNLLAFEQCQSFDFHLNEYVFLFSNLVKSPRDVNFLVQEEIIHDQLGRKQAASFIHDLAKTSVRSRYFYFSSLVEDLNKYCRNPRHKLKAALKQDYFNTPWTLLSFNLAVIFFLPTFIRAVSFFLIKV